MLRQFVIWWQRAWGYVDETISGAIIRRRLSNIMNSFLCFGPSSRQVKDFASKFNFNVSPLLSPRSPNSGAQRNELKERDRNQESSENLHSPIVRRALFA